MKYWISLLVMVVLGLIQVTLLDYLRIFTLKPDLLLICVVLASLAFPWRWVFVLSVFAGLLKDAFAAGVFGINTLLFPLWAFLIVRLSRKISIDSDVREVILLFVAALINNTITGIILAYSGIFLPLGIVLRSVILGSTYTALVLMLVFRLKLKFPGLAKLLSFLQTP